MAKFCTKCGKELIDGKACSCEKTVTKQGTTTETVDIKQSFIYSIICVVIGFIGCIVDSILGASVQAQYYCEELNTITEKKEYKGKTNKLIKGIYFVNNDVVNLSSNIISTLIVLLIL